MSADIVTPDQPDTALADDSPAVPPGREDAEIVAKTGSSLLDRLLNEQQELTAVERFAQQHDHGGLPAQAKYYSHLIPATAPMQGQQYAFDVDLDRCSGCKACVTACHSLNGLDDSEAWRDVGLLVGGTSQNPVMQHVTTACHHCLDPACMTACPVDAYEKNAVTGIVKHIDDQCFGCQYCTLACPYDVPKYHSRKGIVRKCDMCSDRLSAGEAPACVQACPHEAIAISIVETQQVIEDSEADVFLPGTPEPSITLPTTTYRTKRVFPRNLLPVDYYSVAVQHSHWPLIIMLVLTQLSVGAFLAGMALEAVISETLSAAIRPLHTLTALVFGLTALGASTLHLGRPQYAFRAVIGLKHSWLSREIVAFGAFAGVAVLYAAGNWMGPEAVVSSPYWQSWLGWGVATFGLTGVFCSVMIYAFTQRTFWSFSITATKFFLTTGLLGIATVWLTLLVLSAGGDPAAAALVLEEGELICRSLMACAGVKLVYELAVFRHLMKKQSTPLKRSAQLMIGQLASFTMARFAAGFLGGIVMPAFLLSSVRGNSEPEPVVLIVVVSMLFLACLAGELLERTLFFAAVSSARMPGSLRS
jgi:Fe-S-cluster-containing dehydrogenase component/DMSO reductase anchor subunit